MEPIRSMVGWYRNYQCMRVRIQRNLGKQPLRHYGQTFPVRQTRDLIQANESVIVRPNLRCARGAMAGFAHSRARKRSTLGARPCWRLLVDLVGSAR